MTDIEYANLLDDLIAKYNRETRHLEFKSNYQDPNDLGEYISALSNGATLDNEEFGYLFFGVGDETLEIKGTTFDPQAKKVSFKLDKSSRTPNQYLELGLRQFISPKINFEIRTFKSNNGRNVVVFKIPAAKEQPTYFMSKAFVRVDTCKTDLKNYPDWVRQIYNSKRDWSAEIIPEATLDDLDQEAINKAFNGYCERYPERANEAKEWSTSTFLDKAKITVKGKITRTALLLLGKEESARHLNHIAEIVWRLDTAEERAGEIYQPPFLMSTIKLRDRIRNYQIKIFPNNALLPAEVWKYDNRSILEALHNCILHQNYDCNERIIVNEYSDKLVFTNAGAFFEGSYEDYAIGQKTPTKYRNGFLQQAMVNLKMIDSQGFGIHDMFQRQKDRFLPLPEYDKSDTDHVILEIPGQVLDANYSTALMENSSLDLTTVFLLDKVQRRKEINKEGRERLRKLELIEGRYPNLIISKKTAKLTGQEVEYTNLAGLDDEFYKHHLIKGFKLRGKMKRKDINNLLLKKLPERLDIDQKKNKIDYLLKKLKKEEIIQFRDGWWELV